MISGILRFSTIAIIASASLYSSSAMAQNQKVKLDKRVQTIFEIAMKGICETLEPDSVLGPPVSEIYKFTFNYDDEDFPPRSFRLYEFSCTAGAYNFGSVFYGADDYNDIRQIQFAMPVFDVSRQSEDFESAVTGIKVTGFTAYDILISAEFDPETKTITSFSKWRGLADASSSGSWVFKNGQFVLESYDVDASYDGKMNPVRIYGKGKAPQWE